MSNVDKPNIWKRFWMWVGKQIDESYLALLDLQVEVLKSEIARMEQSHVNLISSKTDWVSPDNITSIVRSELQKLRSVEAGSLKASHSALLYLQPKIDYTLAEFIEAGRFAGSICFSGMLGGKGKLEIFTLMQEPKNETKWKLLREQEFVAAGKETVLYIDPLEVVNGVKVVFTQLDGTSDHFIAYDWVFREL